MKLNIGSSNPDNKYKTREWINLDIKRFRGVNVQGDLFKLPFADDSISEIHCIHTLEHLRRNKHLPALWEMWRVLKDSGKVFIEVPDFPVIVENLFKAYIAKNKGGIHIWRTSVYGKTDRIGMEHHFGFDEDTLKDYMYKSGFENVFRSYDMISSHHRQEPVLLIVGVK